MSTLVTAQVVVNEDCDPVYPSTEFCGYFPTVITVPAGTPCTPDIAAAHGSGWVGTYIESFSAPGSHSFHASWNEWPRLHSGPKVACLYAQTDGVLLARVPYTVPPPPAPTPTPTATPTPTTTPSDARSPIVRSF